MARVAAGALGFLIFSHAFDGPDLYGAFSLFEIMASRPSLPTAYTNVSCALAFVSSSLAYGAVHRRGRAAMPTRDDATAFSKTCKRCGGRSELVLTLSDVRYDVYQCLDCKFVDWILQRQVGHKSSSGSEALELDSIHEGERKNQQHKYRCDEKR